MQAQRPAGGLLQTLPFCTLRPTPEITGARGGHGRLKQEGFVCRNHPLSLGLTVLAQTSARPHLWRLWVLNRSNPPAVVAARQAASPPQG
jgi:hypothetical protein